MEPLLFSAIIFLCWIPSIALLILGIIRFFSTKKNINWYIKLSIVCFFIPWVLVLGTRIDEFITKERFAGTYHGIDKTNTPLNVKIYDDTFLIITRNPYDSIEGNYYYSKNYDAFLFQSDEHNISINQDYEGKYYLYCNEGPNCYNINEVELIKAQ